jgi:antitoxin VapB
VTKTAKLFMNGQSQAVRLPKEFRFEGKEVFIKRMGDAVVLMPYEHPWQSLVDSLGEFTDDFLAERRQPSEQQERESAFE